MISYAIDNSFVVEVRPQADFVLQPSVIKEIDALWERLKKQGMYLFNGKLLSVLSFSDNRLVGTFVDYKHYIAALHIPELNLRIQPVCICGYTTDGKKVLVGRRSQAVSTCAGMYELVPSGTVDDTCVKGAFIDLPALFLRELQEEAGITAIKKIEIWKLLIDQTNGMHEICARVTVGENLSLTRGKEHDLLLWQTKEEMNSGVFVPAALFLLDSNV